MKPLKIQNCVTPRDSHSFEKYLQDINRYPLITPEEEVYLAEMYHTTHDNVYLEKLVNANLRFVVSVAKNFDRNNGLRLEDLVNEGNIGLIKAAQRFDHTRGFKFISYAIWWIRQSILQAINEQGALIRIPSNQAGLYAKIMQASQRFMQEKHRQPSPEEIAEILGESATAIINAVPATFPISIDSPRGDDDDNGTFGDTLSSPTEYEADHGMQNEDLSIELNRCMATLTERERSILQRAYGIGREDEAIDRIAEEEHLTRERVRQIIDRALRRLRSLSSNLNTFL